MPGLCAKPREGESVFVYNDDPTFPDRPPGAYLWAGQVLETVADDPDPQKARYRVWGPGGEESHVVSGRSLEFARRPAPPAEPPAPNPFDEVLTAGRLREVVNAAMAAVNRESRGPVTAAVTGAVRILVPYWESEVRAKRLTNRAVYQDLESVRRLAVAMAEGLVAKIAPTPKEDATDAQSE